MANDRLITPSYCCILAANFLLYFGFWLLIPVLPFYLSEEFHVGHTTIGIVLSCYTIAALCVRPFSGYLLDTFARKPLYLVAYTVFTAVFAGYMVAGLLSFFILLRIIHGLAFGMVTVGGNTIVIDIMPSSRRGEGLGYYGLTNNTAMSVGPMFGLFLHNAGVSYPVIFAYALGAGILGLIAALLVKTPYKAPVHREPISLDRFILLKGLPAGFSLIWVKHRHGRHQATPQIALLEGWGELRGAIATSYSHDSHNLVVLGRDANDMALAANQLIASGGGMALAQQGEILAHVAMPIAGMLSDLSAAELARQFRELRDLSSQVADWEPPYRVFKAIEGTCLACNAGPHLTDLGLTDGGSRQIVDPLIACREIPEPTDHNNNPQGA